MLGANFKGWMAFSLCLFLLCVVGCGDDTKQMFETAQFEELQNNHSHARELYERIIQADPDSSKLRSGGGDLAPESGVIEWCLDVRGNAELSDPITEYLRQASGIPRGPLAAARCSHRVIANVRARL